MIRNQTEIQTAEKIAEGALSGRRKGRPAGDFLCENNGGTTRPLTPLSPFVGQDRLSQLTEIRPQRVEVLRGPQGTLYGRNSIGGAINIITAKPGDEDGGRVSLTAGSRGRLNADFYSNMAFSDQLALSVTGAFQHRDGLGRFLLLENPRKEVGEMEDVSGRVALKWSPSDRLSFLLTADANDGDGGLRPYDTLIDEVPNGGVFAAGFRNSDGAANPYNNNTGQESQIAVTNEAQGVSLTVDYEISDTMAAKLLLSDRHSEYQAGLDDDGFFDDFLSFPEDGEADAMELWFAPPGEAPVRFAFAASRIARCSLSNARTSIWRTRSRLMSNCFDKSSSVAGSSFKRRSVKICRSRSFRAFIPSASNSLRSSFSSRSASIVSWLGDSSTRKSCHSPSESARSGAFSEWSAAAKRRFIEITSSSVTPSFVAISFTFSGRKSPSSIALIEFFALRKLKNSFFCAAVVPIFTRLHERKMYS